MDRAPLNVCLFPTKTPEDRSLRTKGSLFRDFVVLFDTSLSVFLDLNAPCRHDFTTLCQQWGECHRGMPVGNNVRLCTRKGNALESFYGPTCCIIGTSNHCESGKRKKNAQVAAGRVCRCTSELKPQEALIRREIQCYRNKTLIVAKLKRLNSGGFRFIC